jgi:putative monooxygenase
MNPAPGSPSKIAEHITAGDTAPVSDTTPGLAIRVFVSAAYGATGFSTGTATFEPRAELPYHYHECSEAIIALEGKGTVLMESRVYELGIFDCIHVPAGVGHAVLNESPNTRLVIHWAFASSQLSQRFVEPPLNLVLRGLGNPEAGEPEYIARFNQAATYELSPGALFRDLFNGSLGSVGICGGYGRFEPGSSLPCHFHQYDESITIVEGTALCLVQGNRYRVGGYDTAFVPVGKPHRFINQTDTAMAMIWVYAGSEPERTMISADYCSGTLVWPGPEGFEKR